MSIKGWIYCMLQLILRIRMNRHLNFKHWWLFPSSLLSLCVFGVYLFNSFHHKVLLLSKAAGIYINVQVSDVFFLLPSGYIHIYNFMLHPWADIHSAISMVNFTRVRSFLWLPHCLWWKPKNIYHVFRQKTNIWFLSNI